MPNKVPVSSPEFHSVCAQLQTLSCRTPDLNTAVIKDECVYSCDSVCSPNGIFVNLQTFDAVGWDMLENDTQRTGAEIYLNIREEYRENTEDDKELVDGIKAGHSKFCSINLYSLYIPSLQQLLHLHANDVEFTPEVAHLKALGLPETVASCVAAVATHSAPSKLACAWSDIIQATPYSDSLTQIPNPTPISMSHWRCVDCGNTKHLWIHLHDGYIGCGRKNYGIPDTGCLTGEEGAAIRHYRADPEKRVLAVKLGTLTPSSADVFCYPEDRMVIDTKLAQHLAHFGINIQQTEKTEKALSEMELEYNKNFDWSRIVEVDSELEIVNAPGCVGLVNFGNTCYMNSILQLLAHVPELRQHLGEAAAASIVQHLAVEAKPRNDIVLQFTKIVAGLTTDRYVKQREELLKMMSHQIKADYISERPSTVISPGLFRQVICADHAEFSTSRQQDAEEFLRYLVEKLSGELTNYPIGTASDQKDLLNRLFTFEVEERLKPYDKDLVRITSLTENILSLPITSDVEDEIDPKRPRLVSCAPEHYCEKKSGAGEDDNVVRKEWMTGETVEFHTGRDRVLIKGSLTRKMKTFPDYLFVQLKRFYMASDWTPKKVTYPIFVCGQWTGLLPNEQLWKDEDETCPGESEKVLVASIEAMGFSRPAALKSIDNCSSPSPSLEDCVNWIIANLNDPQLNEPPASSTVESNIHSERLNELGFTALQIKAAMIECNGEEQRAVEWIVSNDRTDVELQEIVDRACKKPYKLVDGKGSYEMIGFVSHLGKNAGCGHYVCHAKHIDGRWIIFNDSKIAVSKNPPFDMAYLYLYRRI